MTASDLLGMKIIDGIIPEPPGGAHLDPDAAIQNVRAMLKQALSELAPLSVKELIDQRYAKFRGMGDSFTEVGL
jgi:acetyl-CoA carboxylase alpha subunit